METEETIKPIESVFLTPTSFQLKIEDIVLKDKVGYIDAIISFCDANDMEYTSVNKLLSGTNLKEKVKLAAIDNGYFVPESSLPL